MTIDLQWLIGLSVTMFLAFLSMLIGAFWRLVGMIRRIEEQIRKGDEMLHGRINRVRDETVLKSDLADLTGRLERDLRDMRVDQHKASEGINARLDALLQSIVTSKTSKNGD